MDEFSSQRESFRTSMASLRIAATLRGSGPRYVDHLEHLFKDRAKGLRRGLDAQGEARKLSEVQEALAKSVGFPNLHGFQQLLGRIRAALPSDINARSRWVDAHGTDVEALIQLELLGRGLQGAVPADPDEIAAAAMHAERVAKHLGIEQNVARDAIAFGWGEEPAWEKLATRSPLTKPVSEPLVTFAVEEGDRRSQGYFHISDAGHWLWDHVLGSTGRRVEASAARAECERAAVLAIQHPGLFMAWAGAAAALEELDGTNGDDTYGEQRQLMARGIREAESLIPKGFRGTIPWIHQDNRPYLRMLHSQLRLELQGTHTISAARRTAQKLLRLNPTDNQGVRAVIPLLDAICGASDAVLARSSARALRTGGPAGTMNTGLAQLWKGQPGGLALLLKAIFEVPAFGSFLLEEPSIRPFDIRPDLPLGYAEPWEECVAAYWIMATDPEFGSWLKGVLRDPELLREEARVLKVAGTRATGLHWERWQEQVEHSAKKFAAASLQRYPMAFSPH